MLERFVHSRHERHSGSINAMLEKFLNPEKFSTENGAFRKRFSNWRNFKTLTLHFSVEEKLFEDGAFRKRQGHGRKENF